MKNTNTSKAIIYDDNCPMCAAYTQGFVQWGLLAQENRIPFTQLKSDHLIGPIDLSRSTHEIPLIDLAGGKTLYGLDALLYLLQQKIPSIAVIKRITVLYFFFEALYKLVSFNRRIFIPAKSSPSTTFDCTPPVNLAYRTSFVVVAVTISLFITYVFGISLGNYLLLPDSGIKMIAIAGSGWAFHILLVVLLSGNKKIDYLGHIGVVMLIGVFLLLPGIILGFISNFQYPLIPSLSILASSSAMLWQHSIRIRYLQLSQWWTVIWFTSLQLTAFGWLIFFNLIPS